MRVRLCLYVQKVGVARSGRVVRCLRSVALDISGDGAYCPVIMASVLVPGRLEVAGDALAAQPRICSYWGKNRQEQRQCAVRVMTGSPLFFRRLSRRP